MKQHPKTPPEWIKPGVAVWYEAAPGIKWRAVVESEPFTLGHGEWVVRLKDLDPEYTRQHPAKRTTVPAAAAWCLTARTEPPYQKGDRVVVRAGEHAGRHGTVIAMLGDWVAGGVDPWGLKASQARVALDGEPGQVARGPGAVARGGRGGISLNVEQDNLDPEVAR